MVVKKRSEDNTRVKDSDSLTRFASRVSKLKGEGPLVSSAEPEVTLEVVSINICDIDVPDNYLRKSVGNLSPLASSIRQYGIQQPIKVVKVKGANRYRLVFGLRRIKAAKKAGFDVVPCIVELVTIETRLTALAMVENMARLNVNAVEEGICYKNISKSKITEDFCAAIGRTTGYMSQAVNLLNLPVGVQEEVMAEPDLYTWGILMILTKAYKLSSLHGKKLFQAIATGKVNTSREAEIFVQNLG